MTIAGFSSVWNYSKCALICDARLYSEVIVDSLAAPMGAKAAGQNSGVDGGCIFDMAVL